MILDKIVDTKKKELLELKQSYNNIEQLEKSLKQIPDCLGFINSLYKNSSNYDLAVIAEVKKASPSKGIICPNFDHIATAKSYQAADVAAISVLTDQEYFMGSFKYLLEIRKEVNIPLLCKDFIIDKLQIAHARLCGADAILLIARILDLNTISSLHLYANQLGLDCLVEVHDQSDIDKAIAINAKLIGINNRDLQTFSTDLLTTNRCISYLNSKVNSNNNNLDNLHDNVFIISESGIDNKKDSSTVYNYGARGILVGESLMRTKQILAKITDLREGLAI